MTREELKEHCLKQIENCEMWAKLHGEQPHGKVYEEHKLILELLEQESSENVAKECYEDLCRYFGDAKDILKNREDFKTWLDRIKWHIHKAEELSAENDDLRDQLAMRDRFQKQEPCEAISRRAVLALAKEECDTAIIPYRRFVKGINALPPVTPQPKWIPVSENPKEEGCYMTTLDYGEYGLSAGQRYYHGEDYGWSDVCVIAWMPLPTPYGPWESEDKGW